MPNYTPTLVTKCKVFSDQKSKIQNLKLSVSDIPMLACEYIQKGVLLTSPPEISFENLLVSFKKSLATTLSIFPPLAGRLTTSSDAQIHIACNDAGAEFLALKHPSLSISRILCPGDVPDCVKDLFTYDKLVSYCGHSEPLVAVQVTELADGIFIGFSVNHAVVDGASLWHFINTFAEITRGVSISKPPVFSRDTVFDSRAVLTFPPGGPTVTFDGDEPLRERIFHFTRDDIVKLKRNANHGSFTGTNRTEAPGNESIEGGVRRTPNEISSFQSLCAQLWRSVTRARQQTTTFRMAVNCRNRSDPKLDPHYFGNAIQGISISAPADELLTKDLSRGATLIHEVVVAHNSDTVRRKVAEWEKEPELFPLGNADGPTISMGSSPSFPMFESDFGWGRPLAVRSGRNNKFDGKISAFPGRAGGGSVDLEVLLAPETMTRLEVDAEFMQYVSPAECGYVSAV